MLNYLKEEAGLTRTENGAVTYVSTGSDCLDLFSTIGALRRETEEEIIRRFIRAYTENKEIAVKLLFFGRDIRGGLGERRVFRIILKWLAKNEPDTVRKNVKYISEYGRFDDLLCLFGTPCQSDMIRIVKERFEADLYALKNEGEVSLLAKWLPSVNASSKETVAMGKQMAKALGLKEAEYRKNLTALRAKIRIIENNLRERDYSFDYAKQPSRAMFKYRQAFIRNDAERYEAYLSKVYNGAAVLHADNVSPYELVDAYLKSVDCGAKPDSDAEKNALNTTWASLPGYDSKENAIAVIDTSGSMYSYSSPMPASVALSLGLYFAEHNTGIYKNTFIEFSARPQLIEIKGDTFADRLRYVASFNKIADTNLEAVFNMILKSAVSNNVPQEELPAKLIIISDMEFNCCVRNANLTNFENAKKKYAKYGYRLPEIIFWNVAGRNRQQPVKANEEGVALISGVTPRIFSMVAGGNLSPYTLMTEILESERYAAISA